VAASVLAGLSTSFLCLVFVRALLHKLGGFAEFVGTVRDYRVVPWPRAAAVALTVAEAAVVIGLLWPATRQIAAVAGAALLAGYALAIGINLHRGRTTIDCGCGGPGQGISPLHVARNAVLIGFAVPVALIDSPTLPHAAASLVVAGAAILLWMMFLAFEQLLGNRLHAAASTYSAL
jgi:Methylamine utilisation protein MauE